MGEEKAVLPSLSYYSKTMGIGGKIKTAPEDFVVEEILQDGTALEVNKAVQRESSEGDFTWFVLQKREWTTEGAIRRVARALRSHPKRFSYAGSKDKASISTQLASAFRVNKDRLLRLDLKDIKILGAWRCREKVRIGNLLGNRFTVIVREVDPDTDSSVRNIYDELNGAFPNYFGEQRFGNVRRNTHMIGEHIVRGRYDLAATSFLCDCEGETDNDSLTARMNLARTGDFKKALEEFPQRLSLERTAIEHLEKHPRDYVNALRRLPRGILLLFMHSFQSHLFNALLSERIAEGKLTVENGEYYCGERNGFPDPESLDSHEKHWIAGKIIGYGTEPNEREKRLFERLELKPSDFEISGIPELSSKGTYRLLLSPLKDFLFRNNVFRFSLRAGSYGTVALREFLDKEKNRSL